MFRFRIRKVLFLFSVFFAFFLIEFVARRKYAHRAARALAERLQREDDVFDYYDYAENVDRKEKRKIRRFVRRGREEGLRGAGRNYSFHPDCPCSRPGRDVAELGRRVDQEVVTKMLSLRPVLIPDGTFAGPSTCNDQVTSLGAGQNVLSYSFYIPWRERKNRFRSDGRPADTLERYAELLPVLAEAIRHYYPDWRMRIYHNVSINGNYNAAAAVDYGDDGGSSRKMLDTFCQLYCNYSHVDFCDVSDLPGDDGAGKHQFFPDLFQSDPSRFPSDLNSSFPLGRFWRFAAIGDPTVRYFLSRDIDSYILVREVAAVHEWLRSARPFHIMRDAPQHLTEILAGLWGMNNYANLEKSQQIRQRLFSVNVDHYKFYDQYILKHRVWPLIRSSAFIHDSYNCRNTERFGETHPWPIRRVNFEYVGYGPTKDYVKKKISATKCPFECRPEPFPDWEYC